ncbi:phospholipase A1-like [Haematobia irritans]|uniref:phospholipase A1-like n=1 Tax=Haematobia irritans TaxID=7368 RepID=UPI003F5071C0
MLIQWIVVTYYMGNLIKSTEASGNEETHVNGQNGWYIPTTNGSFEWMDMAAVEEHLITQQNYGRFELSKVPVNFYLYTRINPSEATKISTDENTVINSYFDPNKATYVIIHGFVNSYKTIIIENIKSSALRALDCNVIVVDWARARSLDYISSFVAVPRSAEKIAELIDFLHESFSLSFRTLTVVGHSLGAHVAGITGKSVQTGKIHKIIGLDAAKTLFDYKKPEGRLAETDGDYVQAIHTDAGLATFVEPLGNADFYVNGGSNQPFCPLPEFFGICSHALSTIYYAEVLGLNDFGSIRCDDYHHAVDQNCGSVFSGVRMGARNPEDEVPGVFYVPVRSKYPFGILNMTAMNAS